MTTDVTEFPHRSMSIGLVAYGLDGPNPSLVFVRVPTERGRWVLTDRCVVEVPCALCGATIGEPCRRNWRHRMLSRALAHGAGTHCSRREDWKRVKHQHPWREHPKIRMTASDLIDAQEVIGP